MINIIIIEQNKIFRESLKMVLDQIDGYKVVFDDDTVNSLLDSKAEYCFQIILLDWTSYDTEVTRTIFKLYPSTKVLLLSNYIESTFPDIQLDGISLDFIPKCSCKNVFEQKIKKTLNIKTIYK
ncbi:MAG: hypothetical protein HXX09_16165 [Bacteroidetes bacterium]|nr:hypothetical protein [Bacteroidota bacterium]